MHATITDLNVSKVHTIQINTNEMRSYRLHELIRKTNFNITKRNKLKVTCKN
jgi:hypothetical protein